MIDLEQNQTCVICDCDCSEYVFVPVKYFDVTAKSFYVLTHNSPVHLARSHLYKGLLLQLSLSHPSARSASMNVTAQIGK